MSYDYNSQTLLRRCKISGKIPPKRLFGFGSSVPRFSESKKDNSPGPGSYNPKNLVTGPSYTFGKAARFHKAQMRGDLKGMSSQVTPLNTDCLTTLSADKLVSALQAYSQKGSNVTWLYQTSRGDGILRRVGPSPDCHGGKAHHLSNTEFGEWVKSGKRDSPPDGTCSCYEIILKACIETGLMDVSDIEGHYKDSRQSICQYMDDVICKDKIELCSTNPSKGQARPKKGQLILFGDTTRLEGERAPSTNIHVVTAIGNLDGPIRVISHHRKGQPPIELTLDELFQENPGLHHQRSVFSSPQWPKIMRQNFVNSFFDMKQHGGLQRFGNSKKEVYQVRDKEGQVLGYVKPIGEQDINVGRLGADTAILVSDLAKELGFSFVADAFEYQGYLFSSVVEGQDFPSDYFSNIEFFDNISQNSVNEVMLLQALLRPYDDHPGNFKYSEEPDGQLKIVGNFDTEERSFGSNLLRLRAKKSDPDFNTPDDFYSQGVTRNFFPMFKQANEALGETFKEKVLSMSLSRRMPSAVVSRLNSIQSGINEERINTPNDMIALGDPITFSASQIINNVGGDAYSYLVGEVDFQELVQIAKCEYEAQYSENDLTLENYNKKMRHLEAFKNNVDKEKMRMLKDKNCLREPLAYSDSPGPHWWNKNLYTRYMSHQEFFNAVESLAQRFVDPDYKDEGNHFEKSDHLGSKIKEKSLDKDVLRCSLEAELKKNPPAKLGHAVIGIQGLMRHHIISFILGESCKG